MVADNLIKINKHEAMSGCKRGYEQIDERKGVFFIGLCRRFCKKHTRTHRRICERIYEPIHGSMNGYEELLMDLGKGLAHRFSSTFLKHMKMSMKRNMRNMNVCEQIRTDTNGSMQGSCS